MATGQRAVDRAGSPDPSDASADSADSANSADSAQSAEETDEPQGWWRSRSPRFRRAVSALLGVILLLMIAGVGLVYTATTIPLPQAVDTAQTTTVTYADGKTPIVRIGSVNRTDVPLSKVSEAAQHAVLAAEDKNFYSESGISVRGIARAVWADVRGGSISQGGSTITQQYAKNAYLTQNRTLTRKLREIVLAVKLDRKYSKDEILEFYLNTIYFGRGAYGIEAAAHAYFGVPAAALTAPQAAVIAGLIRAPSALDPRVDKEAAATRFQQVIDVMAEKDWIDADQASKATLPLTLPMANAGTNAPATPQAAYIRDEVKRELAAAGINEDTVTRGGLRVTTTLDPASQQAATNAVQQVLAGAPADLQTGVVSMEPGTGRIKAWYGGSVYGHAPYGGDDYVDNVAGARIQPGSSFKPVTLAAALTKGIGLDSRYDGHSPKVIPPGYPANSPLHNFGAGDGEQFGSIDLRTALAQSVNTVFVPLSIDAGLDKVAAMGHTLGIPEATKLDPVQSLTLGTNDVRPLDMAGVYGSFASQGVYAAPHLVESVTDRDGKQVYAAPDTHKRALSEQVSADATSAMQQVVTSGTGTAAQLNGRPAAGKTGTTSGNKAAWFCGFTPQLVTVVDMFRGNGQQALNGVLGINEVSGGTLPSRVFKATMDAALVGQPVLPFPPESHVGNQRNTAPLPAPTQSASPSAVPSVTPTPTQPAQVTPSEVPVPTTQAPQPLPTPQPTLLPTAAPSSPVGIVVTPSSGPSNRGGRNGGPAKP